MHEAEMYVIRTPVYIKWNGFFFMYQYEFITVTFEKYAA